jgi:hypothetical protein
MYTPVGFFAPQGTSWTPADATDIRYWWRADLGVTLSGTSVTSWTDQIAGKNLTPGTGTSPLFVANDATMNNQPAINFNSTGPATNILANTTEESAGTNGSLCWFVISTTTNGISGQQCIGGFKGDLGASGWEMVILSKNATTSNFFSYNFRVAAASGVLGNTGIAIGAPEKSWVGMSHTQSTKTSFYRNGIEQVRSSGALNPTTFAFVAGNYSDPPAAQLPFYGRILECGWLTRPIWTPTDSVEFQSYVNSRYGI